MTSKRYGQLIAGLGFLLSFIYYHLKINHDLVYWNLHLIGFILIVVGTTGMLIAWYNKDSKSRQ